MEPSPFPTPGAPASPSLGRVVGINLAVLVGVSVVAFTYTLATAQGSSDPYYAFTYGFLLLAYGAVHLGLLVIAGVVLLFTERKRLAAGLLLSALVVLLVGASFCFGGLAAYDAFV